MPARTDKLAFILSLLAVLLSTWVSLGIAEGLAQLEDEYTYQWQAQLLATGHLKIDSPPEADSFLIPFVIDFEGQRFGKYPLGWPALLSFGVRFGLARLVNPLLAGLAVWLMFRLGQKLLGDKIGLLAAGLMAISPLFLTYTGSLLAHTWGLVLTLGLALSWLDLTDQRAEIPGWLPTLTAGGTLGVLALTRPWTALGVALPFGIHGIILLLRGSPVIKKRIISVGGITLAIGSLHFLWQFALTGQALQNPYRLWWPYDRIGFGPGIGVAEGGHTLHQAWLNTRSSLSETWQDLLGWGGYTWMLALAGLWAARRETRLWLVVSVFPALVGMYLVYWVSGPRYFFEGLYGLVLLCAAGIGWLAGWLPGLKGRGVFQNMRLRQGLVLGGLALAMVIVTCFYTPVHLQDLKDRYGFTQAALEPFRTTEAQALTPALVIIHTDHWNEYGGYLHLENPGLTTPFIFAWEADAANASAVLALNFPDRTIYHYYPNRPGEFFSKHQSEK
ncbi:MAG TPA: hypothetical protein DEH25_15315 [Chloroflexi bacterium]|nr:hypothetical protein [Chloroflexota bacterium]